MIARNSEVDAWLDTCINPKVALMRAVRIVILSTDPRIAECIKWQAPTFHYAGNMASFMPRARHYVGLMFHTGAAIPGVFPLLDGEGKAARVCRIKDDEHLSAIQPELVKIVRAWCDWKDLTVKG
jgi:hypothetical protein